MLDTVDAWLVSWLTLRQVTALDLPMSWLTAAGRGGVVWVALAGFAFSRCVDRAAAWRVLLTLLLAFTLVEGVFKPLVARPRPAPSPTLDARALPVQPGTYAFPSSHAATTFGAAVTVSRMWPATRVLWWVLAILIGYSRIHLGHHYPLDIIAGALVGIAVAWWVLGGRHPATDPRTLGPIEHGVVVRP